MLAVARMLAFVAGAAVVLATLASALKTVVVPRAEPVMLARWVFVALRRPFDLRIRHAATWEQADRVMSRFAPFALLTLPLVWVALVIAGFMPIYWALGLDWPGDAFEESGSSLLTLGFAVDHHGPVVAAMFVEATIGLGLVALLISFLPTMYQLFSRREVLVSQLDVRAGTPPTPVALFRRAKRIGWIAELDGFWLEWERWFTEVEESHTSYLALSFFRSPHHGRSWITAAGRCSTAPRCGLRPSTCPARGRPSCACGPATWRCGASPGPTASASTPTRPHRPDLDHPRGVRRRAGPARRRGRPAEAGPGPELAGLRRLAGQLRHPAAGAVRAADGAVLAVVLGPGDQLPGRVLPAGLHRPGATGPG